MMRLSRLSAIATILKENILVNPGFESGNGDGPSLIQARDLQSRQRKILETVHIVVTTTIHPDFTYDVYQQTITLEPGEYVFSSYLQGGANGDNDVYEVYAKAGDTELASAPAVPQGGKSGSILRLDLQWKRQQRLLSE